MQFQILPNQRIFVAGKTRSGKSFFIFNIILPIFIRLGVAVVIYDYKWEINIPGCVFFYHPEDFIKQPGVMLVVYRPSQGTDDEFNRLCERIYLRKHTVFIVDDVVEHCPAWKLQSWHSTILRVGAGQGIGNINLAQESINVNNKIIKQAEHYFIFQLPDIKDREKISRYTGPAVLNPIEKHWFYYYSNTVDMPVNAQGVSDAVLFRPIQGSEYYLESDKRGRAY